LMAEIEVCDVCGSSDIKPFKCKLVCQNCGAILKTCSDLLRTADCGPTAFRTAD
jgi:hypothetical protein